MPVSYTHLGILAAIMVPSLLHYIDRSKADECEVNRNCLLYTSPGSMTFWMIVTVIIGFLVCSLGLQKGVERVTKFMMASLFVILIILCIRSVTLPGAAEGVRFYLIPCLLYTSRCV